MSPVWERVLGQPGLNEHIASKHKEKKIKCSGCEMAFPKEHRFRKHFAAQHVGRRLTCKQCEKIFQIQLALDDHIAVVHEGKRFICPQCGIRVHTEKFLEYPRCVRTQGEKIYMPSM